MSEGNSFTPQINYELLVETALRTVVSSSLKIVEQNGLPGNTHFYITFLTEYPGVEIPDRLKESHPEKMTIIIQHQYWDLHIGEKDFCITLSFGGQREKLTIPFMSILDFNDPSVGFGLQFAHEADTEDDQEDPDAPGDTEDTAADNRAESQGADVVSLDTFRKKT
ncbi:SspB family protein [Alphaproteobacteria bacterium LSUCC0684]